MVLRLTGQLGTERFDITQPNLACVITVIITVTNSCQYSVVSSQYQSLSLSLSESLSALSVSGYQYRHRAQSQGPLVKP